MSELKGSLFMEVYRDSELVTPVVPMSIKQSAIESAQSRLKRAEYWLSVSDGSEATLEKKKRTVEVAAYILRAVEAYEEQGEPHHE